MVVCAVWVPVLIVWGPAPFTLTFDDAFYYFQIGHELAHGHGSTFNGLDHTNGYHPLWQLICAVPFVVGLSGLAAVRALLVFQLVLWAATLWVVAGIVGDAIDGWRTVDEDRRHRCTVTRRRAARARRRKSGAAQGLRERSRVRHRRAGLCGLARVVGPPAYITPGVGAVARPRLPRADRRSVRHRLSVRVDLVHRTPARGVSAIRSRRHGRPRIPRVQLDRVRRTVAGERCRQAASSHGRPGAHPARRRSASRSESRSDAAGSGRQGFAGRPLSSRTPVGSRPRACCSSATTASCPWRYTSGITRRSRSTSSSCCCMRSPTSPRPR